MSKNRQNKSISFNRNDAFELKMLAFAEHEQNGDFSKYVKRLIAFDMEGRKSAPVIHVSELKENEDSEAMMAMI